MRRLPLVVALFVVGCSHVPGRLGPRVDPQLVTEHRASDDLLTAGLGLSGIKNATPPAIADAEHPTPEELRRRAIWSSWRGIADLSANGGYGEVYGNAAPVPGREMTALLTVPGATQPHRVLVQVPDNFDMQKRCVVLAPSSGSRGVYGAIAVAGAWGLPRGCAIAYTDKGTGSDYYDYDSNTGTRLDGRRGTDGLAFKPAAGGTHVAFKHAHSSDNPEADWGKHVLQAAQFAMIALEKAFPSEAFDLESSRVIAVGISNGGGAVLRAAEIEGAWLDGVVAGEPNVQPAGARSLLDYMSDAAQIMPCALLHFSADDVPRGPFETAWTARCASLKSVNIVSGMDVPAQADAAYKLLHDGGWTDEAIISGATSVAFDLWRVVAVAYAAAYGRVGVGAHPCGYSYAALGPDGAARATTPLEQAVWFSDASGIPPGAGVALVDSKAAAIDPAFPGISCLRDLATRGTLARGINDVHAGLPRAGLPIMVIHGLNDGLIPPAFSSIPWVKSAKEAGRQVTSWHVQNAQHFDAFLGLPGFADRDVPLLPYVYNALDRIWANLETQKPLPGDATIAAKPRGPDPLKLDQLALPH